MEPIAWSDDPRLWAQDVYTRCVEEFPDEPATGVFNLGDAPIWMRDVTLVVGLQTCVARGGFGEYMHWDFWNRLTHALQVSCERVGLAQIVPLIDDGVRHWVDCRVAAGEQLGLPARLSETDQSTWAEATLALYRDRDDGDIDGRLGASLTEADDCVLGYVRQHKDLPTAYQLPDTRNNRRKGLVSG